MAQRLQTIVGAVYTLTHRHMSPAHTKVLLSCLQTTDSKNKTKQNTALFIYFFFPPASYTGTVRSRIFQLPSAVLGPDFSPSHFFKCL